MQRPGTGSPNYRVPEGAAIKLNAKKRALVLPEKLLPTKDSGNYPHPSPAFMVLDDGVHFKLSDEY